MRSRCVQMRCCQQPRYRQSLPILWQTKNTTKATKSTKGSVDSSVPGPRCAGLRWHRQARDSRDRRTPSFVRFVAFVVDLSGSEVQLAEPTDPPPCQRDREVMGLGGRAAPTTDCRPSQRDQRSRLIPGLPAPESGNHAVRSHRRLNLSKCRVHPAPGGAARLPLTSFVSLDIVLAARSARKCDVMLRNECGQTGQCCRGCGVEVSAVVVQARLAPACPHPTRGAPHEGRIGRRCQQVHGGTI